MSEYISIGKQLGIIDYPLRVYDGNNKLIYYEDSLEYVYYIIDDNNCMDIICGMV